MTTAAYAAARAIYSTCIQMPGGCRRAAVSSLCLRCSAALSNRWLCSDPATAFKAVPAMR